MGRRRRRRHNKRAKKMEKQMHNLWKPADMTDAELLEHFKEKSSNLSPKACASCSSPNWCEGQKTCWGDSRAMGYE